jgi:hypothetical protein
MALMKGVERSGINEARVQRTELHLPVGRHVERLPGAEKAVERRLGECDIGHEK